MEYMDAKNIITNAGRLNMDYLAFEYVMNIYWGCNHGCIYCYARSNYYDKAGNFDCIRTKKDALRIIRDDLQRKVRKGVVFTAGMSDPYNSAEKEHRLTGNALELINAFKFGVCILTKSDLVVRDTDVLIDIKEHSSASVNFSITCSDDETCKKIEPFASTTTERFKAVEALSKGGIVAGVMIDPVIPFITDTTENVRELVKKAKHHGALYVYTSTFVTLADVQREYFYKEAETHYPGITEKYKERYKNYYRCKSFNGRKIWDTFVETCEKENISYNMRAANQKIRQGYQNLSILNLLKD